MGQQLSPKRGVGLLGICNPKPCLATQYL